MRAARPRGLFALAAGFQLLFFASVFARLDAPLLWQDEAETAVFGRAVLEYGVPKIHVGRNVAYGAHLPLALGRDAALDAYLGSPWGQYFFAAATVAWSDAAQDFAARTWRMRLPFAIAGWLGVLLLGRAAAGLWPAAAGARSAFWAGFGACLVLSVSLQLHLREVRYYPLVVLALGVIAQLEVRRARGELPPLRHALLFAPALFALFNLFYPAFTAVVATGLAAHALRAVRSPGRRRARAVALARDAAPYALACAAALPLVAWFGLPAQSRSFFEVFGRREGAGFGHQLAWAGYYLLRFEFTAPVLLGAVALAAARRRLGGEGSALRAAFTACDLALALVAIWVLLIARTPLFFSRYLVTLSPLLAALCMLQVGCLWALRSRAGVAAVAAAWLVCAGVRAPELRGRVEELREPYRGPLDHVIPYLAEHYPRPQDLVIATNYEDFPYMFYLGATTVLGYYAPERERDLALEPDVIIPRPWPVNLRALEHLAHQGAYAMQPLPVANVRVNNFPELSPRNQSHLVHRFRSPVPGADGAGLLIGERVQP